MKLNKHLGFHVFIFHSWLRETNGRNRTPRLELVLSWSFLPVTWLTSKIDMDCKMWWSRSKSQITSWNNFVRILASLVKQVIHTCTWSHMDFLRCSGNVMPPLMAFRKAPKRMPGGASAWTLVTFGEALQTSFAWQRILFLRSCRHGTRQFTGDNYRRSSLSDPLFRADMLCSPMFPSSGPAFSQQWIHVANQPML